MSTRSLQERFDEKWTPCPETGCWLWTGRGDKDGYGTMRLDGRTRRAQAVALIVAGLAVERGDIVCHSCDVPACVNPAHLYIGSHLSNARDKMRRNRFNKSAALRGTMNGQAKAVLAHSESCAKMTHCRAGHEYSEKNTQRRPGSNGYRRCRICEAAGARARRAAR